MSEPWAFPQKPSDNNPDAQPAGPPPERVSVSDSNPSMEPIQHSAEPIHDSAPPAEPIPQPTEPLPQQEQLPQTERYAQAEQIPQTDQFQQDHFQQTEQYPQHEYQPPLQQEQFQQPAPYAQQQYQPQEQFQQPGQYPSGGGFPQSQPAPRKKSGLLGLIGMLLVLAGNIVLAIAVSVNFSRFEFSAEFFESLTRAQFGAGLFFAASAALWVLGSLLCLIALAVRRGVVAGAIGLFIVLVPSWFMAMIMIFAAMGSTALLYIFN